MQPSDPNNTLGNPVPTHINAYYAELEEAREEVNKANGRVSSLEAKIVELGGVVPGSEPVETPAEEKAAEPVKKASKAKKVAVSDAPAAEPAPEVETPAEDASEPVEEAAPAPEVPSEPVVDAPAEPAQPAA